MRNQLAELEAFLEDAHQQRNLETHQRANQDDNGVQDQAEGFRVGEGEEHQRGGESADQADHQLDGDKARHQAAMQESREAAPDPHGEEIAAGDSGNLKDALAQQAAGERASDQLVNEAAAGDQEDGGES